MISLPSITSMATNVRLSLTTIAVLAVCSPVMAKDFVPDTAPPSGGPSRDIINTLKNGPHLKGQPTFKILLDAYENQQAYFDNELKGKGPYTVFACDDAGWRKIPEDDRTSLWANTTKLSEVLKYQVVKGQKLDSSALAKMSGVKTMQGTDLSISEKKNDKGKMELYVDKSGIKTPDIECTNGIIHIVDRPPMPALKQ